MIIYVDILFIKNYIINYFLIEITNKVLKLNSKPLKKHMATLFTTTYSIITILYNLQALNNPFSKLILATLTILIAFKPVDIDEIVKSIIVFYVITYFIGGIATSIMNTLSSESTSIIIAIMIGYIFIMIIKRFLKISNFIYNIEIEFDGKYYYARALLDTGHNIADLISGDTVVILNSNKIEQISKELLEVLQGKLLEIPNTYVGKIRLITYNSIGNEGILYGIRVNKVSVYYKGQKIENKNVVVALANKNIKNVDALIGVNLIEGGNVVGNSFAIKIKGKKIMD